MIQLTEINHGFILRKYKYQGEWWYSLELSGGMGCYESKTVEGCIKSMMDNSDKNPHYKDYYENT